jgi:hypothetical protein
MTPADSPLPMPPWIVGLAKVVGIVWAVTYAAALTGWYDDVAGALRRWLRDRKRRP